MEQSKDNKIIPITSVSSGTGQEVTQDVYYYTNQIVNIVMIGDPNAGNWVLVDAGMPKSGNEIEKAAYKRFGENSRPSAIILTHGHFDHVGSLVHLIEKWNVPVYAHTLEFPYLSGTLKYPEPDTTVEGGMLAKISSIYPNEPFNIREVLQPLPADMSVPGLPGWKWIHVPGHSPGQVALFRETDRILISADSVITVQQDSFYKVLVQKTEVCGPPVYLTTDWLSAKASAEKLAVLNPEVMISGHGTAMQGEALRDGLQKLITKFDEVAVPSHGKFVVDKD
ncbi:MAG: fold metallo-hydrolase [Segetibacter sp.]|nr:fold metallo-hydrolase [Segetibacter sp.]